MKATLIALLIIVAIAVGNNPGKACNLRQNNTTMVFSCEGACPGTGCPTSTCAVCQFTNSGCTSTYCDCDTQCPATTTCGAAACFGFHSSGSCPVGTWTCQLANPLVVCPEPGTCQVGSSGGYTKCFCN